MNDELIKDIHASLTGWDEEEVDSEFKNSMSQSEFTQFFQQYIYSSSSVDSPQTQILLNNKQCIIERIFDYIRNKHHEIDGSIPFEYFLDFCSDLKQDQFKKILYQQYDDKSSSTTPLPSISEHKQLSNGHYSDSQQPSDFGIVPIPTPQELNRQNSDEAEIQHQTEISPRSPRAGCHQFSDCILTQNIKNNKTLHTNQKKGKL